MFGIPVALTLIPEYQLLVVLVQSFIKQIWIKSAEGFWLVLDSALCWRFEFLRWGYNSWIIKGILDLIVKPSCLSILLDEIHAEIANS